MSGPSFTAPEPPEFSGPDPAVSELRRILSGRERAALEILERRFEDDILRTESTGRILPDALKSCVAAGDGSRLENALAIPLTGALREVAGSNPSELSDLLAPVMAPSVAKAIRVTLERMIESLNRTLEHSLSPRSFAWRWEAWRTGRTFAEVVILKTLRYRVEQAFLLRRHDGLLLAHAAMPGVNERDPDMVGGMLAAIGDYARESFSREGEPGGDLHSLDFGDLTIWIEQNSALVLATVVRGNPPAELRDGFSRTLERLTLRHRGDLRAAVTDTSRFEISTPDLADCLVTEMGGENTGGRRLRQYLPAACLVGGLLLLALLGWHAARAEADSVAEFAADLSAYPGVEVVSTDKTFWGWKLHALRDPLVADEAPRWVKRRILGLPAIQIQWQSMISTDGELVLRRARQILDPPPDVTLAVNNGALTIAGRADESWARDALRLARAVPGVSSVDSAGFVAERAPVTLEEICGILVPPDGVTLRLEEGGTLVAEGIAPQWWIEGAKDRAPGIRDIRRFESGNLLTRDAALLKKVTALLRPPPGMSVSFLGEVLVFDGRAPHAWVRSAQSLQQQGVEGVRLWDFSRVTDTDRAAFDALADKLRRIRILFGRGASVITPEQEGKLREAAAIIGRLESASAVLGGTLRVNVRGVADWEGSDEVNLKVSLARASAMRDALVAAGISPRILHGEAVGAVGSAADVNSPEPPRRVDLSAELLPPETAP